MFGKEVRDLIREISLKHKEREVCGFILDTEKGTRVLEVPNSSPDVTNSFRIDARSFLNAQMKGKIRAVFHSHLLERQRKPSYTDRVNTRAHGFPGIIYNVALDDFFFSEPEKAFDSLIGRKYDFGKYDCLGLAVDFYKSEYNLDFTQYIKERTFKDFKRGMWTVNQIIEAFQRAGFKQVESEKKFGDCILFASNSADFDWHVAIYVGNDRILHQTQGHDSLISDLDVLGVKRISAVFRYGSH